MFGGVLGPGQQLQIREPVVRLVLVLVVQQLPRRRALPTRCAPDHKVFVSVAVRVSQRMADANTDLDVALVAEHPIVTPVMTGRTLRLGTFAATIWQLVDGDVQIAGTPLTG